MKARIAIIQIDYLVAFFLEQDATDFLSAPLHVAPRVGSAKESLNVATWRETLKQNYAKVFSNKLSQLIAFCASRGADIVVFPEYSIPYDCLPELQELSKHHKLTIIAGTHRVGFATSYGFLNDAKAELIEKNLRGKAICPIFVRGKFDYIAKLSGSKYDPQVMIDDHNEGIRWGPISVPCKEGKCSVCIFICSDFLPVNRSRIKQMLSGATRKRYDVTVIVSWTPSLGVITGRSLKESASASFGTTDQSYPPSLRLAYEERQSGIIAFVNNAARGGTKVFYDNRSSDTHNMEAPDGTFGVHTAGGATVKDCGVPQHMEAIVIVDLEGSGTRKNGPAAKQVAICPIIHCSGPDDSFVKQWNGFLQSYNRCNTIDEKSEYLREQIPGIENRVKTLKNQLLYTKLDFVVANLSGHRDEERLDSMINDVCIVHETAPHVQTWLYRASLASRKFLLAMRDRIEENKEQIIDSLISVCEINAQRCIETGHVPDCETILDRDEVHLSAEELLLTSGPFYLNVYSERSSSRACANAARWILHLFESNCVKDALLIADNIRGLRPYPAIHMIQVLQDVIQEAGGIKGHAGVEAGKKYLLDYIHRRDAAEEKLFEVCQGIIRVRREFSIVAYGYSEAAMTFLRAIKDKRPSRLPRVFVAEVRNRSLSNEGLTYAEAIRNLGFDTHFVTDSATGSLLFNHDLNIQYLVMGYKLRNKEGFINTVGSLPVASLASQNRVKVLFVGFSFDNWSQEVWNQYRENVLAEKKRGGWTKWRQKRLNENDIKYADFDVASDLVPLKLVDIVATERGLEHLNKAGHR